MFKTTAALLLALVGLLVPLSSNAVIARAPDYPLRLVFDNTATGNVNEFSDLIAACPGMYLNFNKSADAVISVYNVSATDNTAALIEANTRITQLNETKVFGPFTPVKSFIRLIVDRRESNGTPSTVDVSCGTSVANYSIPSPSTAADVDALTYTTESPAPVKAGWGVGTEATPAFSGTLYTDTGPEPTPAAASELNQMMGWYYNKIGVQGAAIPNMFEHAYDFSMENGYRPGGSTIVEWNWDFFAPRIESTLSGATGSFVAGDAITFSGGGSGIVVSSGPPLRWRHNFGKTAAGETVTNQTRAGGGTLGALTQVAATNYRPFLFTYNTMTDASSFDFETTPDNPGTAELSVSAGYARHHGRIITAAVHWGTATWNSGTGIAAGACNTTNVGLSGTGFDGTQSASTDVIRWSFNADVTSVTGFNPSTGVLSIYAYPGANTVNFKLCNTTAGLLTLSSNVTINWIVDRPL